MKYKKHLVFLVFSISYVCAFSQQQNPVAAPSATVVFGKARFTVLTPELIRMEYAHNSIFENKASLVFINRKMAVPAFRKKIKKRQLLITTNKVLLTYTDDGKPFHSGNLSVQINVSGKKINWNPGITDTLNLKGTNRTLDNVKGWEGAKILEDGLISKSGWALVDDSKRLLFNGNPHSNWVTTRTDTTAIDWYLFAHGHNYKKALQDFVAVAGKIPIPPLFAFGYWWSRYWVYSDYEIRDLVKQIRDYNIPLDVFIIDMDWHETPGLSGRTNNLDPEGQRKGWTGYTWNKSLFPNPAKFLQWTNEQNLKTALNLHPASGIAPHEEMYDVFAAKYGFDTTGRKYIPFAISNPKWVNTYFDVVLKPYEKMGVDFWWLDWQQFLYDRTIPSLSNTWWLNHTFFTQMEKEGKKRPLIFHRWGGLGNHRYQVGFSGDAYADWETLDYEIYFTHTASNVGYGYWSHDIGGHMLNEKFTNPENFLRWLQFGVFSPILRTHASKRPQLERRIWKFPSYFNDMRDAIYLRYALSPYIYKSARQAYETGIAICRPMYYEYPEHQQSYDFKTQYFFGEDMLVAPISSAADSITGLAEKKLWLPKGSWFEYSTGTLLAGDTIMTRKFSQAEIPYYIKAGAIIPMLPQVKSLQNLPSKKVLTFIPGTDSSSTLIYEDDGNTDDYKKGRFASRKVQRLNENEKRIKVTILPSSGSFVGMSKTEAFELRFVNTIPPASVKVNNREYAFSDSVSTSSWSYNNKEFITIVSIPEAGRDETLEVALEFKHTLQQQSSLLNGNKGFLSRMVWITDKLKFLIPSRDWTGTLPNEIYNYTSVYDMIRYQPEDTYNTIIQLNQNKQKLQQVFSNIPNLSKEEVLPLLKHLE